MQCTLARLSEITARQSSCQSLCAFGIPQLLCIEYLEVASLDAKAWLAFWHYNLVKKLQCVRLHALH